MAETAFVGDTWLFSQSDVIADTGLLLVPLADTTPDLVVQVSVVLDNQPWGGPFIPAYDSLNQRWYIAIELPGPGRVGVKWLFTYGSFAKSFVQSVAVQARIPNVNVPGQTAMEWDVGPTGPAGPIGLGPTGPTGVSVVPGPTGPAGPGGPLDVLTDVAIVNQQTQDRLVASSPTTWINVPGVVGYLGKYVTLYEEFVGGTYTAGSANVGELGWVNAGIGNSLQQNFVSAAHPGCARLFYTAGAGNNSYLVLGNGGATVLWNSVLEMEWLIAPDNSAAEQFLVGMSDSVPAFTNSIYVVAQPSVNSGRWTVTRSAAGVTASADTGLGFTLGAWHEIIMKKTAANECTVTVNRLNASGGVAASGSGVVTGIPTTVLVPVVRAYSMSGAVSGLGVDFCRLTFDPAIVTRGT